jgi:hypothetical protein
MCGLGFREMDRWVAENWNFTSEGSADKQILMFIEP